MRIALRGFPGVLAILSSSHSSPGRSPSLRSGGWGVGGFPHPGAVSYNPVPALGVGAAWLRRLRGSLHTQAGVEFSFAPCRFHHSAPWVHCLRVHVSLTFHSSIIARGHAITLFCYISLQ